MGESVFCPLKKYNGNKGTNVERQNIDNNDKNNYNYSPNNFEQ
jgi:hypothetical protein